MPPSRDRWFESVFLQRRVRSETDFRGLFHVRALRPPLPLYHWARLATQHDALSRRRYAALRQRGHSHGRALRTVADRLLSVACTLLEQQTLFDP
jgi:hypothetical protein